MYNFLRWKQDFNKIFIYDKGVIHQGKYQQSQFHEEVTPSKQSLKARLISDDFLENGNQALDDVQSIEGKL